jgi:hypothetical protein
VMRWPGCDFYPGLLCASFTSWCTAVQHRATPCAFVQRRALSCVEIPPNSTLNKGFF